MDVGTYAGQQETHWSGRIIIRLDGITWPLIRKTGPGYRLAASIAGRGQHGRARYATVPIEEGWKSVKD